jgi:hypothetical protein
MISCIQHVNKQLLLYYYVYIVHGSDVVTYYHYVVVVSFVSLIGCRVHMTTDTDSYVDEFIWPVPVIVVCVVILSTAMSGKPIATQAYASWLQPTCWANVYSIHCTE